MKKIIFLFITIILLSGCNAEYELNITKDNIRENINCYSESNTDNDYINYFVEPIAAFIDSPYNSEEPVKISGVEYYNISKNLNNEFYSMNINYAFKSNDFYNASIINRSVNNLSTELNYDRIVYNTGKGIKVFDRYRNLNNLTIKINVSNDFEIMENNADEVNNNTLIWRINRSDYNDAIINFSLKDLNKEIIIEDEKEDNEIIIDNNENDKTLFIALGIFLLFVLVLILIINLKKRFK